MKRYNMVLLGIGIGILLSSIFFYACYKIISDKNNNVNETVKIYVTSDYEKLADTLYLNEIIQDKDSFLRFIKNINTKFKIKEGKTVGFTKSLSYQDILERLIK